MDATKIRLSPEEAALVISGDWILTKNSVIQKTIHLLGLLQTEQKALLETFNDKLPEAIIHTSPKISRGENYKGLPWLMLDYPRLFNKDDNFAIRSFFWWGNFFSGTLQLSGVYKKTYELQITRSYPALKAADFFVCINDDPWQHHFGPENYQPLHVFTAGDWEELILTRDFVKLSKTISLQEWNDARKKLMEIFSQLIRSLTGQLPSL